MKEGSAITSYLMCLHSEPSHLEELVDIHGRWTAATAKRACASSTGLVPFFPDYFVFPKSGRRAAIGMGRVQQHQQIPIPPYIPAAIVKAQHGLTVIPIAKTTERSIASTRSGPSLDLCLCLILRRARRRPPLFLVLLRLSRAEQSASFSKTQLDAFILFSVTVRRHDSDAESLPIF